MPKPTKPAATVALIINTAAGMTNNEVELLMDDVYAEEVLDRDGSLGVTGAQVRAFIEFRNRVKGQDDE